VGRKQGITEAQLLDLAAFETSSAFTELERLVLRYAVAMTQTPVEVPDELFARLRQHFDPRQMVELTSAIAWENYRARFDHTFGIEAEGFSTGSVCALAARGPQAVGAGWAESGAGADDGRGAGSS
jgi:4-carboxymuconolactone decarboxylase